MKRLRVALATAMIGAFAVLAPSPAEAYPGVTVTVSEATVVGGNDITISAEVDPDIDCDWELTFLGDTRTGSGTSITETFDTPEVDEVTEVEATATCTFDDSQLSASSQLSGGGGKGSLGTVVTAIQSSSGSGTQTLLPEGDDDGDGDGDGDDGGLLPNTGGERLAWLLIGALLILVGGGVVVASRRRDA